MNETARARFVPILAGASLGDRLVACLGAAVAIGLTSLISARLLGQGGGAALVAPIGASALLLFVVPASPLAQPWPILGGNLVSALVGLAAGRWIGAPPLAAGVAVGGAILAMSLLRCLHPPSAAAALVAALAGPAAAASRIPFPLLPLTLNSLLLVAAGLLFHRLSGHSYPHRPAAAPAADEAGLLRRDIDRALADAQETFDIDRADLDALLAAAEGHAASRRRLNASPGRRSASVTKPPRISG